ncbi:MAG: T9SS type A sorting domain-containing protein [Bacteroidota bacterium]
MNPFIKTLFAGLLLAPLWCFPQSVINVYARVTAISGTSLTITGATGSFTAGEAIIMQMQDSTIGTNTSNNSGFGNLASIQSAGLYEVVTITAATSTSISLSQFLINAYHFTNNSRVQIISYPTLGGGGNYTLSSDITATSWNGATGGVVAFKVGGTLNIDKNITVTGQGFRGGAAGSNAPGDMTCDPDTYYDNAGSVSTTYFGYKGEGIHNTNGVYTVARGKMLNGGGGGNANNGGGGGGGNLTAGGTGGLGWTCTTSTTGGGIGGIDISVYVSGTRFFMGGGGGGGQQNNGVGTAGANGGGIVIIKAAAIETTSGCNSGAGQVVISTNGNSAGNAGNDGAGGGGAGGSIILDVPTYNVTNACPINISTSGGNGGNVNDPGAHGGGAGGGKGVVIMSGVVGTPAYVNVTDTAGTGGANSNVVGSAGGTGGATVAGSGVGSILFTTSSMLPVTLTAFEASAVKNTALLQWHSGTESNFAYYQLERSVNNGNSYAAVTKLTARGSNTVYNFTDDLSALLANGLTVYYRLKMVDNDGGFEYSNARKLSFSRQGAVQVIKSFPNPATATVYITSSGLSNNATVKATIHDIQGRLVKSFSNAAFTGLNTVALPLDGISNGQYIVTINGTNGQEHTVITKQ